MRYQNCRSFEKHLENASGAYLCRAYLIAVPDDYERQKALDAIRKKIPSADWVCFSAAEKGVKEFFDAMQSPSLFGDGPAMLLDEAEKLGKKDLQALADLVASSNLEGYLVCGARSKTALGNAFEKAGIVLDLCDEKPWDKEKRLAAQLLDRASQAGKRLDPEAAVYLHEEIGSDAALLDAELEKLICFVGERTSIKKQDVIAVSVNARSPTLWALAEQMVWDRTYPELDAGTFHGLIPALRSQFTLGLKIASLTASGCPKEQWGSYLNKIWPKTLEKRTGQALHFGPTYFQKGIDLLFEIELLSRKGQMREKPLLDFLWCSLGR